MAAQSRLSLKTKLVGHRMTQIGKVLITGGAGFIGSHLAEELARQGYHIIIVDDLSTGKVGNIKDLLEVGSVEFLQESVTDLPLLKKVSRGVDAIFHLAAVSNVPQSIDNPIQTHEVNNTGTLNVLLAASENGVKKVIYASSSSVYGDTSAPFQDEDMLPNPLSPYAVTKLTGEYYCRVFQEMYGLPTASLRYFNVYGPGQDADSQYAAVIPKFIKNVLSGKAPIIFGDGEQTRDFTFVRDVIAATILAALGSTTGVFNIGSGRGITINKLARLIIRLSGSRIKPVYSDPRPGDIRHSLPDISQAMSFGYKPEYNIEAGIKETLKWLSGD